MSNNNSNNNYGSITNSPPRPTRLFARSDEQRASLLHTDTPSHPLLTHFSQNISPKHADVLLLTCYTITGLLDSSTVATLGAFASMQTGNTIYLGSGLLTAHQRSDRGLRALISIASFCCGSAVFARYHRCCGARRRWVLVASLLVQMACLAGSATLVMFAPQATLTPQGELNAWVAVPLALLGFQAAGQAYLSRVLKFNALTSVVLTSVYHDLFADAGLFARPGRNVERNQRVAAVVLLLGGAMLGGVFAQQSSGGLAAAVWTATALKGLVMLACCLWKAENA